MRIEGNKTMRQEKIFQKWSVREIVTAVLMTVFTILLMFAGSSITMLNYDFAMIASGGFAVLPAAPAFMLMVLRVNRCGVMTVFTTLASLLFCTIGNFAFMIPFYIIGGIALDLIFFRSEAMRQNVWYITAAWTTFSGLYLLSTLLPFFLNLQAYIESLKNTNGMSQEYIDVFLRYFSNPVLVAGIAVLTMALDFLGSLIGQKLAHKHFEKANVL